MSGPGLGPADKTNILKKIVLRYCKHFIFYLFHLRDNLKFG
jgi:hypothetical protein